MLTGAVNIVNNMSDKRINIQQDAKPGWNADYLYFSVREPFPSRSSQANLVFGKIMKNSSLKIISQMPDNGVIFSDGIESAFLQFNSGLEATITVAEKKGHLVL